MAHLLTKNQMIKIYLKSAHLNFNHLKKLEEGPARPQQRIRLCLA